MKGLVLKVTVLAISLFSRIASAREPFDKKELSKNLMTLRTDFNKIVEDAENFSMDFFKQVAAASAGTFDNDVDYRWDSADSSNTIHKQNNQVPLTSSTVKETTWEDTITPPTSPVAIQSFPPLLNRKKRMAVSREPAQSEPCAAQNQREYELEKRRLFELKTEVQRLNEVVALLRDQQELLQALERKSNDVNADPKTKREIQTLLQLLGVDGSKKNETQRKEPTEARIEIETIKNDLKRTAEALNRTHEMLVQEQRKEETIEEELDSQKRELGFLKVMLMSLYEKSGNRNTSADPVVGAVHRPKSLPPKMASTRQAERGDHLERASGDDVDVDKLLNLLEQSKKKKTDEDDLKSKILELEAEVKKKKEREELAKAIRKMTAKSDPSTKLAQALIALNQPQSKADDDDVEAELQSLQAAINRLRPDDDSALAPVRGKNEAQDFQAMLTKLLTQNGVPQQAGIAISGAQKPQFSPEQWFQLSQMMSKSGYGPGFSAESVYGKPLGPYRDYDYGGYDVAPPPFPRGYGAGADRQYLALLSGSYNRVNPYSLPPYDSQSSGYGAYPAYDSSRFKTPYGSNYYNPPQYKGPFVGPPPPYATENSYGNINGGPKPAYFKPQTSDVQKPFFYPGSNYAAASSLATKPASYGDVAAANYNPQFFPPMPDKAPDYPGGQQSADYGPKGYTGSGLDQSSYTVQKANDNYAVIADLKQQIGNLENVIKGLSRADYSQKPEDKETIANLEQKIYELKNVISAINQPSYDGGQNGGGYDQKASADGAGGPAYVSPPKARRRREAPDERQEPRTRIAEPDPLSQVAAFFQNYLKENSTPPGAERSGNVAELQAKLDALKTQG
ncbi:uncharacterized protein LOC132699450 [Cylas formicarius]|uniref:uncharacterized protein LOC132699450 n=1 Tax=Cylas formicarius TaxID=197179 RepID=UPI0029588CB9|nr:uncharacterized protein LOC132699450 [Cylas formicarius]